MQKKIAKVRTRIFPIYFIRRVDKVMEKVSLGSGGSSDILQVYAEGLRKQNEINETIAKINLQQKMQAGKMAMINSLLGQFYA